MKIFSHRGVTDGGAVENTIDAFKNAVSRNIGAELDVRLTADGVPVVFHDKTLKRLGNSNRKISEIKYEELKTVELICGGRIPALTEVLDTVCGRIPLLIELKTPKAFFSSYKTEKAVIKAVKNYKGEFMIQSFNAFSVRYCRKRLSGIKCGRLAGDMYSCRSCGDFVNYRLSQLTAELVKAFRELGLEIYGWGIYDAAEAIKKAEELGIDGIVL